MCVRRYDTAAPCAQLSQAQHAVAVIEDFQEGGFGLLDAGVRRCRLRVEKEGIRARSAQNCSICAELDDVQARRGLHGLVMGGLQDRIERNRIEQLTAVPVLEHGLTEMAEHRDAAAGTCGQGGAVMFQQHSSPGSNLLRQRDRRLAVEGARGAVRA